MITPYTTSLPVSQRIKELIGEQDATFYHDKNGDLMYNPMIPNQYIECACFTLSELPEVLKKVGEKLGWRDYKYHCTDNRELWLYHYLKCCELHAFGQSVDNYLMELFK